MFQSVALAAAAHAGYNRIMATVSQTIRVKVLFFGRLKDAFGGGEDAIDIALPADVEALFAQYAARNPHLQQYRTSLVASCNREFVDWGTTLRNGDEVAFLPPVSGG